MPSPFPGLDPWLEQPTLWDEVHENLLAKITEELNPLIQPLYRVVVARHTFISLTQPNDFVLADEPDDDFAPMDVAPPAIAPLTAALPIPEEIVERYLEIRDATNGETVTVLRILTPHNKIGHGGRQVYEEKRQEILSSTRSLVELDLLRVGHPMDMKLSSPQPADYRVVVSRGYQRPYANVYLWTVRQPLPEFPIPLRQGEEEPIVDLGWLLRELYTRRQYHLTIDYTRDPIPVLADDDARWADELLRMKGLRV